ncbi:hypothetical protein [Synoicihabitans lomoniglobus]|uniref:DUF6311 domain-containing protein n=1 Tax=Synoicihabitans lomoniglobus TaxID=2909285 RepID=A0AAF0I7D2_9BACT|nr:hypothetical protein [Opitutaceae bacterium LMO-M01]WED66661.1 hypothetical protein PXH66_07330 [Opitutaceae bacterium LMO-M01]
MPKSPPHRPSSLALWTAAWLFAGVVQLTHSIWGSGFAALPGGLGDSRFNLLVLEHGYLSLLGHYDWLSPGQFFPTTHTLGWSDTHLGTLPIYVPLRAMGLSPERAMQGWFIICAALNMLTGARLLRQLRVPQWWIAPLAFLAFASAPMAWFASNHPQLLPLFPALWALGDGVAFLKEKRIWRLASLLGALGWQFAAVPYLAFFSTLLGILLMTGFACFHGRTWWRNVAVSPSQVSRPHLMTACVIAGIGMAAGALNLWVYLGAVKQGVGRPMQELIELAPRLSSWFSASSSQIAYTWAWPGQNGASGEHVLFGGFTGWVLSIIALGLGLRRNASAPRRVAALFAASGLIAVGFFTSWPGGGSLWLSAAHAVESLRAFRAAGRIAVLIYAFFAIASGLILVTWWQEKHRALAVAMAVLMGLEGLSMGQPRYQIADALARRDALISAWEVAGDRAVMIFAPGFTNQHAPEQNLDAWAAALHKHAFTMNGYTGGAPETHLPFIWSPTEANARQLISRLHLPENEIAVVTSFPAETAQAVGYTFYQHRALQHLEGFDLQPYNWSLFTPLERFVFDDVVYYQFTPPAELKFRLPDGGFEIEFLTGLRPGSYSNGGESDGYTLQWEVIAPSGEPLDSGTELIAPRSNPDQAGLQPRLLHLPAGVGRELILTLGPGPSGYNSWDWALIGRLQIKR